MSSPQRNAPASTPRTCRSIGRRSSPPVAAKKGIRLIVATQSVQQLHNRVLGSCETLIAHRLIAPADQDPVIKWMRANAGKASADEVEQSLASIPTGTAWVCSGEAGIFERIAFPRSKTFDNTATPTDDAAEIDVKTAAVDHDELRTLIGDALATEEAKDPKKLQARIGELERELATARGAAAAAADQAPDPAAIAAAEQQGFARGLEASVQLLAQSYAAAKILVDGVTAAADELARRSDELRAGYETASAAIADKQAALERAKPFPRGDASGAPRTPPQVKRSAPNAVVRQPAHPAPAGFEGGNSGEVKTRVLAALGELKALGVTAPTRELVGAMAGYRNITSKSFRQAVATLIAAGWIGMPAEGRLTLTPAGAGAAGASPRPSSADEMRSRIVGVLGTPSDRILDELIRAYPEGVERVELGRRTGYANITSKAFRQAVAQLIDMGFAANVGIGIVQATEALFP